MSQEVTSNRCFRCGDRCHGPNMAWRGYLNNDLVTIVFHLDCWAAVGREINDQFEQTKKLVMESDKRGQG